MTMQDDALRAAQLREALGLEAPGGGSNRAADAARARVALGLERPPSYAELGYTDLGDEDFARAEARLNDTESFLGATVRGLRDTLPRGILGSRGTNQPLGFGAATEALGIGRYVYLEHKLRRGEASRAEQAEHLEMFAEMAREPGISEMAGDIVGMLPGFAVDVAASVGIATRTTSALSKGSREAAIRMIRNRAAGEAEKAIAKRIARTVGAAATVAGTAAGVGAAATASELGPRAFDYGGGRWTAYSLQRAMPQLLDMEPEDWESLESLSNGALVSTLAEDLPIWQGALDNVIELASEMAGAGIARGLRATVVGGYLLGAQKLVLDKIAAKVGNRGPDLLADLAKRARYEGPIVELLEERLGDAARVATGLEGPEALFPELDEFVAEVLALSFPAVGAAGVRRIMTAARPLESQPEDFGGATGRIEPELARSATQRLAGLGVKNPVVAAPETQAELEAARWAESRGRSLVLFDGEMPAGSEFGGVALDGSTILVRRGQGVSTLELAGHELTETVGLIVPDQEREAQRAELERRFPGLLARAFADWEQRVGAGGRATEGDPARVQRDEGMAVSSEWVAPLMAFAARNAEAAQAVQDAAQTPSGGGFFRGLLAALRRFLARVAAPNAPGPRAEGLAVAAAERSGLTPAEAVELSTLLSSWMDAAQPVAPAAAAEAPTEAPAAAPAAEAPAPAPAGRPAPTPDERERRRRELETTRRLAAIPLPGDVVELMGVNETAMEPVEGANAAERVEQLMLARVLETLDGGRRLRVRVSEGPQRALQGQQAASQNRAERAANERIIDRGRVRIVSREEPPPGSVRARLRERTLRQLQGGPERESDAELSAEVAAAEREAAMDPAERPQVSDVVRVTARGKQGLADVLAVLRGGRLRVRLRPDEAGGGLARSGSRKHRTVEVSVDEVEIYERRAARGPRGERQETAALTQAVAEELLDVSATAVPKKARQPKNWPNREPEEPRKEKVPEAAVLPVQGGRLLSQELADKRLLEAFNLDADVVVDKYGVVAENMTDQPRLTLSELRRAGTMVSKLERAGAQGEQSLYQGNKSNFLKYEARSLAMALATRQDAEVVYGMYAGGGTYELSVVATGALPKVKRVVLNEIYPPRRARLELALAEGDAFMSEWKTNPTLQRLYRELLKLTQGRSNTPAQNALDFATGIENEQTKKSIYQPFAKWTAEINALPLRARAALQAYHDIASVKRNADITLDQALVAAAEDMRKIKRHGDAVRARGVAIEVVGMNAYGADAIAMVKATPGAVVFLDPPYHRTNQGNYVDDQGVKHDLGSDEQAAAFTFGAVAMQGDNLLIYHNNATPEVRDMLHSRFAGKMHLRLWRRKSVKSDPLSDKSGHEWTAYVYGRPGDGSAAVGADADLGRSQPGGGANAQRPGVVGAAGGAESGRADGGSAEAVGGAHPRGPFNVRFEPVGGLTETMDAMLDRSSVGHSVLAPTAAPQTDFEPFSGLNIQPHAGRRLVEQSLMERLAVRTTDQRKARPLTLVDFVLSMGGLDLRGAEETNENLEWAEAFRELLASGRRGIVGILKEANSKAVERGGTVSSIAESLYGLGFRDPQSEDGRMSFDAILDAIVTEVGGGLPVFPQDDQRWLEQEFARQEFLRHEEWSQMPEGEQVAATGEAPRDGFDVLMDPSIGGSVAGTQQPQAEDDDWVPFAPPARRRRVAGGRIRRTLRELVEAAKGQAAWRDWYERHESLLRELFVEDAELFRRLLAVTSQAASVQTNVALALKAYGQYLRGEPFAGFLEGVRRNLERVRDEVAAEGPKIGAFDAATGGAADAVVVDRHIARLLFNVQVPNQAQIAAAQRRLSQVAQQLGWAPREVQAALWAFNQVRLGANPESISSYDRYLEQRRGTIAAVRAAFGRGEGGGVRAGVGVGPGLDGAELGLGPDENLRFAPAPRTRTYFNETPPMRGWTLTIATDLFTVDGNEYGISMEREDDGMGVATASVAFSRERAENIHALQGDNKSPAVVMATVADFVIEEVVFFARKSRFISYAMEFSADSMERSRVRLYETLARRLEKHYGVEFVISPSPFIGGFTDYRLIFGPRSVARIIAGMDRAAPLSPPSEDAALRYAPMAWHVSPARFDRFDPEFVGTGVGAQRHGWGFYFGGLRSFVEAYRPFLLDVAFPLGDGRVLRSPDTARGSRMSMSETEGLVGEALFSAFGQARRLSRVPNAPAEQLGAATEKNARAAIEKARDRGWIAPPEYREAVQLLDLWSSAGQVAMVADTTLYRVDIAPSLDDFLLWNTRVHGQSASVQPVVRELLPIAQRNLGSPVKTGGMWYEGLVSAVLNDDPDFRVGDPNSVKGGAQQLVSQALHLRGVRGIVAVGEDTPPEEGEIVVFEPDDVTILERFAPMPRVRATAHKVVRALHEYIVSDVRDIEELQEEVSQRVKLPPSADFVGAIDLARSQAPAQMDAMLRRLERAMGEFRGVATVAELQRLLYVRTAPDRNAWMRVAMADRYISGRVRLLTERIAKEGPRMSLRQLGAARGEVMALEKIRQGTAQERLQYALARRVNIPQSPAGISNLDAMAELARLRQKLGPARADRFLEFVRAENLQQLEAMVASELLTAKKAAEWHAREPYYVSLRDVDEDLDAGAGYVRPGRSVSVRGPLFRRAEGRETEAERVLEAWLEDKLRRYEHIARNDAMRTGAQMGRLDPSSGMTVLNRLPRGAEVELAVPFYEGGQQRWLLMPSASAAQTLKGLHGRQVGELLGILGVATRTFSRAVTARNPFFWLPNFLRDNGQALWTLVAERGFREGMDVMARSWRVLPAMLRHALGKPSSLGPLIEQATQDGIKTTFVGAATLKERLQLMHDALADKSGPVQFVRRALRTFDALSDAFETATRLAMYQHELERGRSRREAALAAKNITVNFDKKGTLTPSLAALYSFFNPAVQGSRRIIQAALGSRRSVAVTAGTATVGLLWEMLAYAMSDDDEATGLSVYGLLADWSKDRNLHMPFAVGGVYLTYPLPYGISSIFGFGRRMAHLLAPGLDPNITVGQAISSAVWQTINEFQPMGDVRDPFVALAPTVVKPIVEIEQNVKFGGRPIQRQQVEFGERVPDSARPFSTLTDRASGWLSQHIADVLNAGGPADVETGLDVSPASIQHVISWIGAGFGLRELDRVSQFMFSSRDVPVLANTPVLRNFTNEMSSHAISENYYELRARADRVWRRAKDLRGAPRAEALAEDPQLYQMAPGFRATDKRLRALQRRLEVAGAEERRELQAQRLALQAGLVRQYYGATR